MSSVLIRSLRHATEADHAAEADYAVNADEATNADTAKNAGTVGGYAPNGLLRAARATPTSSVALTVSYQTLATLSITAPSPGFVIVNSTVKGAERDLSVRGDGPISSWGSRHAELRARGIRVERQRDERA